MEDNTEGMFPTTELATAFLSQLCSQEASLHQKAKTDIKETLITNTNVDLENIDVNIVENTSQDINLSLPYYSVLDTASAKAIFDEELSKVRGGEILLSLAVFFGGIGATFLGIGAFSISTASGFTLGAVALGAGITAGVVGGIAAVGVGATAGIAVGIDHGVKKHSNK